MSEHTPGPWVGHENRAVRAADGRMVARVFRKADRMLIAAAPNLLEALERLLAQNEAMGFRHSADEEFARGVIWSAKGVTP